MEQNGINSCTGNSRHVYIHYSFLKHRGYKNEITLDYCPTHHMVADYFTKSLQGKDFNIFHDMIMKYYHVDSFLTLDLPINERVEKVYKIKLIEKSTIPCIKKEYKIYHALMY